jgi:hypothetical protein
VNRFSVRRYSVRGRTPADVVYAPTDLAVPVVDKEPLFEMLGERWPGIAGRWLTDSPGQWLGSPRYVAYERPVILDGSCSIADCCGVVARISLTIDTVVWDDFYSHGAPDLPVGLAYEFDRGEYEAALRRFPTLQAIDWVQTDEAAY